MPINFRGRDYSQVKERIHEAHGGEKPVGIQSIKTWVENIGKPDGSLMPVYFATVTFKDSREFTGSSEIKFESTQPAEAQAPLECAETSAVGRALAFANYPGSADGIAGIEEIAAAVNRAEYRAAAPQDAAPRPMTPQQGSYGATPAQINAIRAIATRRSLPIPSNLPQFTKAMAGEWLDQYGDKRQ